MKYLLVFAWLAIVSGCTTLGGDHKKAEILLRLGTSQIEAGDYPSAMRTLLEAEKNDPSNPVVQNNLGLVYFFRDRIDLAEKHIRNAVSLKPDYTDAKNNLGRILTERGRPHEETFCHRTRLQRGTQHH